MPDIILSGLIEPGDQTTELRLRVSNDRSIVLCEIRKPHQFDARWISRLSCLLKANAITQTARNCLFKAHQERQPVTLEVDGVLVTGIIENAPAENQSGGAFNPLREICNEMVYGFSLVSVSFAQASR
jgi:hypothetical protein